MHIYHFPAEMAKILELAAKYKLKLIEARTQMGGTSPPLVPLLLACPLPTLEARL